MVIVDCRLPSPGIVSDGWRILDRPHVAAVIIRLTGLNFWDPVESIVTAITIVALGLSNQNVRIVGILGLVDKSESSEPVVPVP
jgi:hypothetical protein